MAHLNITKWSPNHVASAQERENGAPSATYFRAAVTPAYQGWDFGFGLQSWRGSAKGDAAGILKEFRTEAYAVDAQAQGEVGGMPLGVYLTYGKAKASDQSGGPLNLFNDKARDKKASTITAELGFIPNRVIGLIAYRKGDTGDDTNSTDNAWTLGLNYKYRQNVIFSVFHSKRSGDHYDVGQPALDPGGTGTSLTTFMVQAGF